MVNKGLDAGTLDAGTLEAILGQLLDHYRGVQPAAGAAAPSGWAPRPTLRPAPVTRAPPPQRAPAVPAWVRGDPFKETSESRRAAAARNAKIVEAANRAKIRYDFVLYGDSITQYVGDKYMDVWNKHFGHLRAAPLGIGGNTVEELSYRVALGRERFATGPRVVGILIGINNVNHGRAGSKDPSEKLDQFLLPYLRATWPDSRILLLGMLPCVRADVRPYNAKYRRIAEKHGAQYLACGADLDPADRRYFPDGTHPSAEGYHKVYPCVRRAVDAALSGGAAGRP